MIVPLLLVALLVIPGCSLLGDPRDQANDSILQANDSIAQHNELFQQARDTYNEAKQNIESGKKPAKQQESIAKAKDSMQEARGHLQDARGDLSGIDDLDVDAPVKRYASLLSGAMKRQLAAEDQEIEFYDILQDDPALKDRREEASSLLSKIGEGYTASEQEYKKAQDLANENPDLLGPAAQQNNDSSG